MVRLRMHVDDRLRHWPGQHYLLRLRAPDDYTAQRSYSVASDDDDPLLEFLVEKLPGGEVSEFLADVAEVGDVLEMRGPIGRWFTWDTRTPALCLVGGTGVVPAVAMTRAARRLGAPTCCGSWRWAAARRAPLRRRAGRTGARSRSPAATAAGRPARRPPRSSRPCWRGSISPSSAARRASPSTRALLLACGVDPRHPGRAVRRDRLTLQPTDRQNCTQSTYMCCGSRSSPPRAGSS